MMTLRRIVLHHPDAEVRERLGGLVQEALGQHVQLLPAGQAREVWNLARTSAPDVLVLDLAAPGATAVEMLAQLHAEFPGHLWAVVLLLPDEQPSTLREALEAMRAGGLDYVLLPAATPATLGRAIRQAATRAREMRARRSPHARPRASARRPLLRRPEALPPTG